MFCILPALPGTLTAEFLIECIMLVHEPLGINKDWSFDFLILEIKEGNDKIRMDGRRMGDFALSFVIWQKKHNYRLIVTNQDEEPLKLL
jgi:hypothetical protein